ncbi:hypothetical protein GCM10022415_17580 [Knoellia locipacati]|uniref:Uncharacterized protein n=1 Tax=Knoellia locipacati TaxID=882824 RepID=A0A512T0H9_9MICO|nr:hypothetical protein [Knoellia locipacati]GEQ13706.1 hypothetical protein KLO01_17530 [Knoellia locipacati]
MTTGVGHTVLGAEPAGVRRAVWLRRLLGALIVAAWVAWLVPSWMSSLNEVQARDVLQDVRAERVVAFVAADLVRPNTMRFSALGTTWDMDTPGADADGRPEEGPAMQLVYSVEGDVRPRWLPEPPPLIGDQDVFAALKASGAQPFTPETFPPNRDWVAFPALFASIAALVSLLTTTPTRGTRPFWVFAGSLGMGLGVVGYAVAELWWPRTSVPPEQGPDGEDVERRLRWWHGLGVAVVGGLVVAGLRAVIT